jgi:hypothetical protein
MRNRQFAVLLLVAAVVAGAARLWAQDDAGGKEFPFDKGLDTIDVSSYPKKLQDIYTDVFSMKCSKCHTLARPINAPFALPEEWQAYVTCMQHKKRSGVDADSAKKIIEFLTYDSSVRKKDLIAQKEQLKKDGKYVMTFEGSNCQAPAAGDAKPAAAGKDDSAPKADAKPKSGD